VADLRADGDIGLLEARHRRLEADDVSMRTMMLRTLGDLASSGRRPRLLLELIADVGTTFTAMTRSAPISALPYGMGSRSTRPPSSGRATSPGEDDCMEALARTASATGRDS